MPAWQVAGDRCWERRQQGPFMSPPPTWHARPGILCQLGVTGDDPSKASQASPGTAATTTIVVVHHRYSM